MNLWCVYWLPPTDKCSCQGEKEKSNKRHQSVSKEPRSGVFFIQRSSNRWGYIRFEKLKLTPRLLFAWGAKRIFGKSSLGSVWWSEIRSELEYFVRRCNPTRDTTALDAGQVLPNAQTQKSILDELLAG